MARRKVWFGTVGHMQWVPEPSAGITVSRRGYSYMADLESGGADGVRSAVSHLVYDFDFPVQLAKGNDNLDVFNKYASGYYGTGLIYFSDPTEQASNLFPAHWASPGLAELGWPVLNHWAGANDIPTFANTVANTFDQPLRTPTYNIVGSVNTPTKSIIIPVPAGSILYFGWSGTLTGTGVMLYRTISNTGALGTWTAMTALSPTTTTRTNLTVTGALVGTAAIEVGMSRTSVSTGTVSPVSMMARLDVGTGVTGNHYEGRGHTGLMFNDEALPETYYNKTLKGLSTSLTEVGAWQ